MKRSGDSTKPEANVPAELLVRCPKLTKLEATDETKGVTMGDLYNKSTAELLEMYTRCATKDDKLIDATIKLQEAYNRQD